MNGLRRKANILIIGFVAALLSALCASCSKNEAKPSRHILVLHTYFEELEYTQNLKKQIRDEIRERGLNADVRFFSAECPYANPDFIYRSTLKPLLRDTLEAWDWHPDIIILEDNGVFNAVTEALRSDTIAREVLSDIPIVFSNVSNYNTEKAEGLKNITGFFTRLHIKENAEVIRLVTGRHYAFTELSDPWDSIISTQIQREIEGFEKYVFNHGWMIPDVSPEALDRDHASQFVLTPISSINDRQNVPPLEVTNGRDYRPTLTSLIQSVPHFQILYDVNSEVFVKQTNRPQFTCINTLFGSKAQYLAGHFVSQETQRNDCMDYVEQIMKGKRPDQLPVREHKAEYFMDWEAMKLEGMKYGDWSNRFIIINAPFDVRHNIIFISLIVLSIIMIICGTAFLFYSFYRTKLARNKETLRKLNEQMEYRKRVLAQNNSFLWNIWGNNLTYTNQSAQESNMLNVIPFEKLLTFIHPQSQDVVRRIKNISYPFGSYHERVRVKTNDSSTYRWFNISFTVTREAKEKKMLYGTMFDIEETKKTEDMLIEALNEAEKANIRETFLANMSHDIRTPLGSITGFAQLLAESGSSLSAEEKAEMASTIKQNSDMLLKLIDDAIDITTLQVGQFKFHKNVIKAQDLIKLIYSTNKILTPQDIDFRTAFDRENCEIEVDLNRTQQVLNNFLSNSFKFTRHGHITVGYTYLPESDEVELYVEDTGCGIAQEDLPRLFDRFYKTNESHAGTGLGLNICQEIVTQQGGRIDVRSEVGRGSRFSCFFAVHHQEKKGDRP